MSAAGEKPNKENIKDMWVVLKDYGFTVYCIDQPEYVVQWDKHFKDFSGSILEIGAGNGFMARHIVDNNPVDYTILDIPDNVRRLQSSSESAIANYEQIKFIPSTDYKKIFKHSYDILISHQCLSETPAYYYSEIWNNLDIKNCFIIDNSTDKKDPDYNEKLKNWVENSFQSTEGTHRNYNVDGYDKKGIMVYIGKGKKT
tara:strand:- start:4500 stop:5099 length:600 start_codon:yes stop_codon:yes gene_type:complete